LLQLSRFLLMLLLHLPPPPFVSPGLREPLVLLILFLLELPLVLFLAHTELILLLLIFLIELRASGGFNAGACGRKVVRMDCSDGTGSRVVGP